MKYRLSFIIAISTYLFSIPVYSQFTTPPDCEENFKEVTTTKVFSDKRILEISDLYKRCKSFGFVPKGNNFKLMMVITSFQKKVLKAEDSKRDLHNFKEKHVFYRISNSDIFNYFKTHLILDKSQGLILDHICKELFGKKSRSFQVEYLDIESLENKDKILKISSEVEYTPSIMSKGMPYIRMKKPGRKKEVKNSKISKFEKMIKKKLRIKPKKQYKKFLLNNLICTTTKSDKLKDAVQVSITSDKILNFLENSQETSFILNSSRTFNNKLLPHMAPSPKSLKTNIEK